MCENAGFSGGKIQERSVVGTAKQNLFQSVECPKFIISDVRCNGNEKKLAKCAFKVRHASCNDIQRAVGVVCGQHTMSRKYIIKIHYCIFNDCI